MPLGRLLLVALLAAGCATAPPLEETSWRGVGVVGVAPVPGSDPRISFAGDLITGHTGCNTFGGRFRMGGDQLILGDLGMTAIGCPGALADQEEVLVRILGGTVRASLSGDRLTLASEAGRIDLVRIAGS